MLLLPSCYIWMNFLYVCSHSHIKTFSKQFESSKKEEEELITNIYGDEWKWQYQRLRQWRQHHTHSRIYIWHEPLTVSGEYIFAMDFAWVRDACLHRKLINSANIYAKPKMFDFGNCESLFTDCQQQTNKRANAEFFWAHWESIFSIVLRWKLLRQFLCADFGSILLGNQPFISYHI